MNGTRNFSGSLIHCDGCTVREPSEALRESLIRATKAEAERDAWKELAKAYQTAWLHADEPYSSVYEAAKEKREAALAKLHEMGVQING